MNIQNSPKQIALTNDQINGIKNKYASMVPQTLTVDNANEQSVPTLPQAEVQFASATPEVNASQSEPNIFDTSSPVADVQVAPAAPIIQEPIVSTENVFDTPSVNVPDNTDVFAQTNNPTNADIISNDQSIESPFATSATTLLEPAVNDNVFDVPAAPNLEPVQNPSVAPSEPLSPVNNTNVFNPGPEVAPVQNPSTNNELAELMADHEAIVKEVVNVYTLMSMFGAKMQAYVQNHSSELNQNLTR